MSTARILHSRSETGSELILTISTKMCTTEIKLFFVFLSAMTFSYKTLEAHIFPVLSVHTSCTKLIVHVNMEF